MKKIIIFVVLLLISGVIMAAEAADAGANTAQAAAEQPAEKTIIVYDVYRHMETADNIFLGIGGLSFAVGTALATSANGNQIALGAGLQSVIWGAAETGLYIFNKNFGKKELDPEKARLQFAEMSGWHALIDLAIMAGGGCIAVFGNDTIKGHGIGLLMQGAMLATYDSINFFIASNPDDVKNWGAGIRYNIQFANK